MSQYTGTWSEAESSTYRDLSAYAVPRREEQIELIVDRVAASDATGDILEICCGEGLLMAALAVRLPDATLLGYDGSDSMLDATRSRVPGDRLVTRKIDLADRGWRTAETPLRAVVSSLAIHHLDGPGKRDLYSDILEMLTPGGVFVLADIIRPLNPAGYAIAAKLWDSETRQRSVALDGDERGFALFQTADWNHFHHGEPDPALNPDPIDKPSTLTEQLDWLRAIGFIEVDLHWMTAGQMILSAVKPH